MLEQRHENKGEKKSETTLIIHFMSWLWLGPNCDRVRWWIWYTIHKLHISSSFKRDLFFCRLKRVPKKSSIEGLKISGRQKVKNPHKQFSQRNTVQINGFLMEVWVVGWDATARPDDCRYVFGASLWVFVRKRRHWEKNEKIEPAKKASRIFTVFCFCTSHENWWWSESGWNETHEKMKKTHRVREHINFGPLDSRPGDFSLLSCR